MHLYLLEMKEKEALQPDSGNSRGLGLLLCSYHLLLLAGVLLAVGQLELVPGIRVVRVAGDQADQQEAQESLHGDHCYDLSCFVCGYVILMMICFQLNLYK